MTSHMRWLSIITVVGLVIGGGLVVGTKLTARRVTPAGAAVSSVPITTDIETATLHSPIDRPDVTGVATRQFVDVVFVHGITAVLPDLPVEQFYAGWFLTASDPDHPLSTGRLVKDGGQWLLSYSSPTDQRHYDGVIVTVQSGEGQPSGPTVLTGTFLAKP